MIVGSVYSYTKTHPITKPALPLGKRPKQQQSRQAPQRQHAFHTYQVPGTSMYCSDESGTKAVIFLNSITMNVTVCGDTIYDLRLAQPSKKTKQNEARKAPRFLRLYHISGKTDDDTPYNYLQISISCEAWRGLHSVRFPHQC